MSGCKTHSAYDAVMAPKTDCHECWRAYARRVGFVKADLAFFKRDVKLGRTPRVYGLRKVKW
jgi:hypothetical protein